MTGPEYRQDDTTDGYCPQCRQPLTALTVGARGYCDTHGWQWAEWRTAPDTPLTPGVMTGEETRTMTAEDTTARLEYLRGELRGERISLGELLELQSLAESIDPGDVELLEAAGVPEFAEDVTGEENDRP